MTDIKVPRDVFQVFQAKCVTAKLVKINHSWWHIKHGDGSITKENGGGKWRLTISEAWYDAIFSAVLWCSMVSHEYQWEAEQQAGKVIHAALDDLYELGRLVGRIEELLRKGKDDRRTKHQEQR